MKPVLLLVEDDPTSHAFLLAATRALEVGVEGAVSMQAAIALASHGKHAAWLIDVHLPDGSGIELLQRLRALGLRAPALAHTAAREPAELQRLLDAGFDAAVAKPLAALDWQAALCRLLPGIGRAATTALPSTDDGSNTHGPSAASASPSALPVWDDAAALLALKGNRAHVDALRELFLDELPGLLEQIDQAASHDQPERIRSALHKLSASCGFVGARRLAAAIPALQADPVSESARGNLSHAAQATLSSS